MGCIIFIFFLNINGHSQEQNAFKKKSANESKITYTGDSYPKIIGSSEQHSSFTFSYKMKKDIFFEWQGHYDKDLIHDVFRMPLILKKKINEKLYVFSGTELEMGRGPVKTENDPLIQFKVKGGVKYILQENFSVDLRYDKNLQNTVDKIYGVPSVLSINGKFRF